MRPNILWICTDQQRWDTIHALGNDHIRTPNMDRLVREGTAFDAAFCQSPICTPSRASFLTGLYPSTVHGTTNGNIVWEEAAPLITKLLADAGYDCGLVGKFHLAGGWHRVEPRPKDDGYRVFEWSHAPRNDWPEGHAWKDWVEAKGHDLGELCKDMSQMPPELHREYWCTERAIDFIEGDHGGKPWLMTVNYYYPHPPFTPPQSYRDRYNAADLPAPLFRESDLEAQTRLKAIDFQSVVRRPEEFDALDKKAAYYGMIEFLDDLTGMLLESLERTGQLDNTLIIFMSDHGETLGDHGLIEKGCRFYEGLVRVPLIFRWPDQVQAGVVSRALVELTDIVPTLLDICEIEYPDKMMGRSLWPILSGQAGPQQHRDFVRCEYYRTLMPGPETGFEGTYATMIRDARYKLVVYHGHNLGELFDLEDDPGEFTNLWDNPAYAEVRFRLLLQSFDALAFAVDYGSRQILYS